MNKITNFEGIEKYFCTNCNHFHIKKYKYKIDKFGKRIKSKDTPFFRCMDYAYSLTSYEKFKIQLNRNLENYSIKGHKKTNGSKKQ